MSTAVAVKRLQQLGFKLGPKAGSKILSLTYQSTNARGYISIRFDKQRDVSGVIAEFWCRTKTKGDGFGAETYLVRFTPKLDNVTFYRGLNSKRCEADFIKIAGFMSRAVVLAAAFRKF